MVIFKKEMKFTVVLGGNFHLFTLYLQNLAVCANCSDQILHLLVELLAYMCHRSVRSQTYKTELSN